MNRILANMGNYRDLGAGFLLGLAFFGVAIGVIGASRRVSARRQLRTERASMPRIDGARPINKAAFDARPMEMDAPQLASEIENYAPTSQRW